MPLLRILLLTLNLALFVITQFLYPGDVRDLAQEETKLENDLLIHPSTKTLSEPREMNFDSYARSKVANRNNARGWPRRKRTPYIQDISLDLRRQVLEWTMHAQQEVQEEQHKKVEADTATKTSEVAELLKVKDVAFARTQSDIDITAKYIHAQTGSPKRQEEALGSERSDIGKSDRKKIHARSENPSGSDRQFKKSSISDMPIHQRHQVLQWAMIEQRKQQESLRVKSIEAKGAAEKLEESELETLKRYRSLKDTHAQDGAYADFRKAGEMTEQHFMTMDNAAEAMKEPGVQMETVGGLNKEMRQRMKETFTPLPNPDRRVKISSLPPFYNRHQRKGYPEGPNTRVKAPAESKLPDQEKTVRRPGLRGQPSRAGGVSIVDMKDSDKHEVLSWTMQHQKLWQGKAVLQNLRAIHRDRRAKLLQIEGLAKWTAADDMKEYRTGKKAYYGGLDLQDAALVQSKAARAKFRQARKNIWNIGMINKKLHHHLKTDVVPLQHLGQESSQLLYRYDYPTLAAGMPTRLGAQSPPMPVPAKTEGEEGKGMNIVKHYPGRKTAANLARKSAMDMREAVLVHKTGIDVARKSGGDAKKGGIDQKATGGVQPAGGRFKKALGGMVQKAGGGFNKALGGIRKVVNIAGKIGGDRKTGPSQKKAGGGSQADSDTGRARNPRIGRRGLISIRSDAPLETGKRSLRGKAGKVNRPSIHDMPLHAKHQVLEWTMTGQRAKQEEAQTRAGDAAKVAIKEAKAQMDGVNIKHHLQIFPPSVKVNFVTSRKAMLAAAFKTDSERQVVKQIGTDIERVGMINKDMRDRILRSARPVPNPAATFERETRAKIKISGGKLPIKRAQPGKGKRTGRGASGPSKLGQRGQGTMGVKAPTNRPRRVKRS